MAAKTKIKKKNIISTTYFVLVTTETLPPPFLILLDAFCSITDKQTDKIFTEQMLKYGKNNFLNFWKRGVFEGGVNP